uniref:Uncharacterized protein n=1 Tax=Meloidogyne enterolobii TaxID=390850 RepID=A0A6V7XH33_MELEN|nr:unnamed protein product [Meloidogyne enterolobii]
MDGSDEFCLPGQIECGGQFCAEPIHLGDCLLLGSNSNCTSKNKMEGIGSIPSFCEFLNASTRRRLCHLHNSIACRGYGQCILTRWLMDGKKDCLDSSDEDPGYVGLFNTSFDRPFLSLPSTSNNPERLTTQSTSTKTIVDYTSNSFTNIHQLVWPQRGKILNPIKNTNNNIEPSQQQKLRENNIFVTTPTYPFEKIFTSSSKSPQLNVEDNRKFGGKSEEESKLEVEKSKNIEIWGPKITEKQTALIETSTAIITKGFEGETTTTVPAINNFISITTTLATESATQEIENVKLLSTKPIVIDVDTTLKSEELLTTSKSDEENEKEKSSLWLFLLLLFLFCLCCLILPLFWWCCSSKQRRSNFFTIFRRRWRNIKLKMGGKQTQSALLPTIAATTALTASTIPTKVVIPQESGISVISESVEESTRGGGFSVGEHENTLKIPTIGEVGRIASLAQAWQQQHQRQSKIFDDSEDYLIMEECEEEEIVGGTDLVRRQSSITTFLDKAKTFEKKDTTTTKTTTTTTITEEKKEEEGEKQKEEEKKPTIELQKSSTITEGTSTIVETKTEEEKEEKRIEVVDKSLQLPSLLPKEKTMEEEELPRSSSATSRPGTPTIWDQFRVLGEQYSGADDQIALATERRDSLDDILIKMDTLEKQQILPVVEKHEVIIEELDKEKDEEIEDQEEERKEDEEERKEEKVETGKGLENEKDTTTLGDETGLAEEKTEGDVKKEKEVKEGKIKLEENIKKGIEILPKIEKDEEQGKLATKKVEVFKKQYLEKQQKLPSIPPLDIKKCARQHPSSSTLIKTKKEVPRLDRIEKTTKEDKSKKDEKEDVFVLIKGHRVFDGHERKTPLFSIRREDKQKEKILSKQKQQKIELNEKKRTELKKEENTQPKIKQRRERLLKLRAQHPIIESSCDEQFVEEPIFDPDLPSTSNYHQQHMYINTYIFHKLKKILNKGFILVVFFLVENHGIQIHVPKLPVNGCLL